MTVPLYFWIRKPNFGDQLSPLLVEHFSDIKTHWAPPLTARLVSCGSVLSALSPTWAGIVLGSGFLHSPHPLPLAMTLAVRGELTARALSTDCALGDPGLLCDELVPAQEKLWDFGIVPHWTDDQLAERFRSDNAIVIDPAEDPLVVLTKIASCRRIISSSLHGIVVADAFGIPRQAERFPLMFSPYEGGEFKWHDYSSVIGTPLEFGKLQEANREDVERAQWALFDAYDDLGGYVKKGVLFQ